MVIKFFFFYNIYRFKILPILCCVVTLCLGEDVLQFIAMGDFGIDRDPGEINGQITVAEQMAAWANTTDLNFILTLGDNFYPVGAFNTDDEQFNTKWRDVRFSFISIYVLMPNSLILSRFI